MKNGIYQVLDFYKSDDKGNIYIFRKVFDGKLNFKASKADIVHDSWMTHISDKNYSTQPQKTDGLSLELFDILFLTIKFVMHTIHYLL